MIKTRTIFINGKFAAQRVTGVQRLSVGLIQALDMLLIKEQSTNRIILLCPPGAKPPLLNYIEIRFVGKVFFGMHFWEQFFLPAYTLGRQLINLAGPSPIFKHRQVCMIPDAAVFDCPEAYTSLYVIWYKLLFHIVSHTAQLLLTISEFSRQRLIRALGSQAGRLQLVSCAASHMQSVVPDFTCLDKFGLRGGKYLLGVASLNPTKNLPALIAAFGAIDRKDIRLVIVGGGNQAVFAGESLNNTGDSRIITVGVITDSELSALYRHAHAFIFPSLYEGFGIPPLEAMSLGCPVIASRSSSIPEVCGDAALYFDPYDISDMRCALERVLDDNALCQTLRQKGAARFKIFSWERAARELYAHLKSIKMI